MRVTKIGVGIVLGLALGCGGAVDTSSGAIAWNDAAQASRAPRAIVGTLRMRDHDVVLTADALDARDGVPLDRMTAQAMTPVMADIDERVVDVRDTPIELGTIRADLDR